MLSLKDLNLKFNPFEKQIIYDYEDFVSQPFLLTDSLKMLKIGMELNLQSENSLYYLIIGERGSGKTTSLLFLKDIVKHKNNNHLTRYERNIKGMGSYTGLAMKLLPNKPIHSSAVETIKSTLRDKKYYWFIDVPDIISKQEMELMLRGIELVLGFKNISIIISMNMSHYDKSFDYSEIFGKFMIFKLKPFTFEETKELINKRIENATKKDKEHKLRFTDEAILKINEISKGIPRNIISACNTVMLNYMRTANNPSAIDDDFIIESLGQSYAKRILEERTKPPMRDALECLYNLIKNDFDGKVESETKLAEVCLKKLGTTRVTLRKRLQKLERLGLITIRKSSKDYWTNIIEVVI